MGDPMSMDTQVGPVTTQPQYKKVLGYIDIAKAEGVTTALGGAKAHPGTGRARGGARPGCAGVEVRACQPPQIRGPGLRQIVGSGHGWCLTTYDHNFSRVRNNQVQSEHHVGLLVRTVDRGEPFGGGSIGTVLTRRAITRT